MKNIKKLALTALIVATPLQMTADWTNPYAYYNPHEQDVVSAKLMAYSGSAFIAGFLANIATKNTIKQKLAGNGVGIVAATGAHLAAKPLLKRAINDIIKPDFGDASHTPPRPELYITGSVVGYTAGAVAGTTTRYVCSKVYSGVVGAWNWLFGSKK